MGMGLNDLGRSFSFHDFFNMRNSAHLFALDLLKKKLSLLVVCMHSIFQQRIEDKSLST